MFDMWRAVSHPVELEQASHRAAAFRHSMDCRTTVVALAIAIILVSFTVVTAQRHSQAYPGGNLFYPRLTVPRTPFRRAVEVFDAPNKSKCPIGHRWAYGRCRPIIH